MGKNSSSFLVGALIGGAAAASAALLFAPKSGKKLRKDMIIQLDDISDGRATEYLDIAKNMAGEYSWLGETISQRVDQAKLTSKEAFNQFKETADNDEMTFAAMEIQDDEDYFEVTPISETEEVILLRTDDVSDELSDIVVTK
ncbi:YtxH domain-containing protein [Vagococcus vulneris]|uniref:YtxH domain-containing protein n=1 Tax=Vagococcus vulneris TaxID=1977869 RepID=A0A430A123_9ENTE|nr:YtxH domain-containing protein [Vagococcus vulneris]RSU00067.1 hypothetical protein CBF37_01835 [Vagococcus vulneris]